MGPITPSMPVRLRSLPALVRRAWMKRPRPYFNGGVSISFRTGILERFRLGLFMFELHTSYIKIGLLGFARWDGISEDRNLFFFYVGETDYSTAFTIHLQLFWSNRLNWYKNWTGKRLRKKEG